MRNLIKAAIILGCLTSGGSATAPQGGVIPQAPQYKSYDEQLSSRVKPDDYQAQSSGGISMDFAKRFGKHCTSHKNFIGRQVAGLCDSDSLCTDAKQYKACYDSCIVKRKKVDEKTDKILYNLATCESNAVESDAESKAIKQQAIRRLNDGSKTQIKVKTLETPADNYKAKSGGFSLNTLKRLGTHCTSHKNKIGLSVKGICDAGDQCNPAKYKQCYKECVVGRDADDKTPYILSNLSNCNVNFQDKELGVIAQDVYTRYQKYEMGHVQLQPTKPHTAG